MRENEFVADLLPRLQIDIMERLKKDIIDGRMAFNLENLGELGPKGQVERL